MRVIMHAKEPRHLFCALGEIAHEWQITYDDVVITQAEREQIRTQLNDQAVFETCFPPPGHRGQYLGIACTVES